MSEKYYNNIVGYILWGSFMLFIIIRRKALRRLWINDKGQALFKYYDIFLITAYAD